MKRKFKLSDIRDTIWAEATDPLELIESGQWVDEGKYQRQKNILKDIMTGKLYCYELSKSGSHFTDFMFSFEWDPDEIELGEVEKATKVITYWKAVE